MLKITSGTFDTILFIVFAIIISLLFTCAAVQIQKSDKEKHRHFVQICEDVGNTVEYCEFEYLKNTK